MDSKYSEQLVNLMESSGAFKYSKDSKFKLASNEKTNFYYDMKKITGSGIGINLISNMFYNKIKNMGVESVGGVEAGSISIATAISQLSYLEHKLDPTNPLLDSFFVRKKDKDHGIDEKRIAGKVKGNAVIVEDVITSGESALNAVNVVRDAGHECNELLGIIFRGDYAQRTKIKETINLQYLYESDVLIALFTGETM